MRAFRDSLSRNKERLRFLKPLWVGYRVMLGALPWRWLPFSSRVFGPPKGWHARTADYLSSDAADPRDRASVVLPAETIARSLPRTIESALPWKYAGAQHEAIPPTAMNVLHDVRFWGDYAGTLIGRDDRVLGDLTRDVWEVRRHKIFTRWRLPRCRRFAGVTAILSVAEAEANYWHWTLEVLPRVDLLRRAGFSLDKIDRFVVNHRDRAFQRESLEEFGIPWEKVVRADADLHVECECALISDLKPGHLAVNTATVEFLRSRGPGRAAGTRPHRRIYVTRRSAIFRRVIDEAATIARLERRGFEVVECDKLTVAEQRKLFSEAAVVVGAHGAGLANLVYCPPCTRVLELLAPRYVDLSYWCFTGQLGLEHWILLGEGDRPLSGVDPMARQDDIAVDANKLETTLDAMER